MAASSIPSRTSRSPRPAPATRRAYVDRAVARLLPARASAAGEYGAALAQRNAGLRGVRSGLSSLEAVAPWTEAVSTLGEALVRARMDALELVAPAFAQTAGELGLADATLAYDGEPASVEELSARMGLDVERGVTGAGPHLHDVRIEAGVQRLEHRDDDQHGSCSVDGCGTL